MKKCWYILCLCLLMATGSYAEDGKFMKFMYRVGVWLDDYSLKGLDTSYIALPEFPWRIALTNLWFRLFVGCDACLRAQTEPVDGRQAMGSGTDASDEYEPAQCTIVSGSKDKQLYRPRKKGCMDNEHEPDRLVCVQRSALFAQCRNQTGIYTTENSRFAAD